MHLQIRSLVEIPALSFFRQMLISDEQMLKIAKEMNLSETAFVVQSSKADFGARYFTPAEEIPLAGHPTIATMRSLIETNKIDLSGGSARVSLELKAGVVWIDINQAQTVSTGTPQLMVPVKNLEVLKRAAMDVSTYKAFKTKSDFFSPHLFCLQGVTANGATFARHFGIPPDTAEDAFTGSATGGMAAYIWHHQLIATPRFTAEQGHWMGRPGRASVEIVGAPENIETVKVGGNAVVLIKGEIDI